MEHTVSADTHLIHSILFNMESMLLSIVTIELTVLVLKKVFKLILFHWIQFHFIFYIHFDPILFFQKREWLFSIISIIHLHCPPPWRTTGEPSFKRIKRAAKRASRWNQIKSRSRPAQWKASAALTSMDQTVQLDCNSFFRPLACPICCLGYFLLSLMP